MNCKIVISQLDDYLDGYLKPGQLDQFESHLGSCESCHQAWQDELRYRQLLKEHPLPGPSAGFEDRAFALLPRKESNHRSAFVAGFGGAMAAGIMLFVAVALFFKPATTPDNIPNIQLTLNQSKKVNMVFNVPEAVAEATFTMQVPEHINIAGRQGLHKIEWKTALKKGKNLLSLPVVASYAKSAELVAKIRYGNKEKVFRMKLDIHNIEQGLLNTVGIDTV